MTASCSPIQRDVKPVGADSLIGSIPIAHHRNAGTYDSLCSPLQSLLVHREAAIIGTCIETSLGRLGQSGCKRWRGRFHHRSSAFSKFPANSLLFVENSLLSVQKFPAPLRRQLGCKPMDSLAEWRRKLANEPKIFKNSLQIPC